MGSKNETVGLMKGIEGKEPRLEDAGRSEKDVYITKISTMSEAHNHAYGYCSNR